MKTSNVNNLDEKIKAKERPQSRVAAVMGNDIDRKSEVRADGLVQSVEKRTHRTSIVIRPTTYSKAIEKATSLNISFNEAINQLLEAWIK